MTHKVFVSYHHRLDQSYADQLRSFYGATNAFIDRSLPEEIDSDDDDYILGKIRTEHLKDSTVTIVLVGAQAWSRKWVDWEIYSSLRQYRDRKINGLLGILLPTAGKLPDRLSDNVKRENVAGQIVDVGYAKLVRWDQVCPPTLVGRVLGLDGVVAQKHRDHLASCIQRAFENREQPQLIENGRPRFKKNKPVAPSWS